MIKSNKGRWYIKQGERVQGPFPNKLIGSYLILGRITQDTLVSQDNHNWAPAKNFPAIVPEVVKEAGTVQGDRALMLARIREDERSSQSTSDPAYDGDELMIVGMMKNRWFSFIVKFVMICRNTTTRGRGSVLFILLSLDYYCLHL